MPEFTAPLLARMLEDKLRAEFAALRGGSARLPDGPWPDATALGDGGLGADSLELMGLASSINAMFHLHEAGIEDYLLARRSLGAWRDLIIEAQRRGTAHISFSSSGSSGVPKTVTHRLETLWEEAAFHARTWPAKRVLAAVPAHHIYGFIWTVMVPTILDCAVIDIRQRLVTPALAQKGDLIVAFPDYWHHMSTSLAALPPVRGVTSTAPMPTALFDTLKAQGLTGLIEIYGASETAGLGWRESPQAPFRLLPRWEMIESAPFPDRIRRVDDRHFHIDGRIDGAVQVGGINVYPAAIADHLETHSAVAEARVRPTKTLAGIRLKAVIVPADQAADPAALTQQLEDWIAATLSTPERPKSLTIRDQLPRNAMGKDQDWEDAA